VLLATTTEDEATVAVPEGVRRAAVAAQPQGVVIVYDEEHVEVAVRVANGLHTDEEPLASGLILVLQAQLGTYLVRAELEAELESSFVDVAPLGAVLEAELGYRDVEEIELHLGVTRREGRLAEDVVPPIADAATCGLDDSAEVVGRLGTRSELDGFPDLELGGRLGWTETREELLKPSWVVDPILHQVGRHVWEVLCDSRNQLSSLLVHGVFSFSVFAIELLAMDHHHGSHSQKASCLKTFWL